MSLMQQNAINDPEFDVLIVGCGPSGATLANILRQRGRHVAIFDRDKEIFNTPRAMTIDGEACRIFQSIDVQDRLAEHDARAFLQHIFVDENRELLCKFNFGDREGVDGYPAAGVRFHQPALEKFLREDFDKGVGVTQYLGREVENYETHDNGATLTARNIDTGETERYSGKFIVAADGGASKTRKFIGSQKVDFNYSRMWIVIDIILHDQKAWDNIHEASEFMCREDSAVVFVKGFHNHVRFDFEADKKMAEAFTEQDALTLIQKYIDVDPKAVEFLRVAPYHFYAGMPDKWRKGRVLLMGDAAHLTSPFSGQGLCMGIRDAANLGFKIDMILDGIVDDRLLDTYQEERWKHCEQIIAGASERGKMISASSRADKFKRYISFLIGRRAPKLAMELMRRSSIAFPYEQGLVGTHKLAGYLMIQPVVQNSGGQKMLMDEHIGNGFALISTREVNNQDTEWFRNNLGGTVNVVGQDMVDVDGKLAAYFDEHKIDCLLVRPDRYIYDAGQSGEAICSKLQRLLEGYVSSTIKQVA